MSSDHQPRTLLIAWKTSSGPWSTAKAAVKLAFPVVLAVMSGLLAGWVLGPANMVRCRVRAAIGGALRHLRPPATYLAGFWPCEYVAASDGGLDSGALGEPGQLRAAVTGLHEKPFHMLFHRADRQVQRPGYLPVGAPGGDLGQHLGLAWRDAPGSQQAGHSRRLAPGPAWHRLAHDTQRCPALAGEVGQAELLEVRQGLPQPYGRLAPPVAVGAGGGQQPGQATGEPALDAAQGTIRRGEDRCRVPALPADGHGVSRCQGGAAHRGVEAESPAFVPGLRPARVGDGSQQRPPAREVMRAAHGPQYVHGAVHRVQRFEKPPFAEVIQGEAVRQRAHFYSVAVTADRARLRGKGLHRRAVARETVRYRLQREARREGSQAELARGLLATAGGR